MSYPVLPSVMRTNTDYTFLFGTYTTANKRRLYNQYGIVIDHKNRIYWYKAPVRTTQQLFELTHGQDFVCNV